jgi:hypothetical protein
MPEYRFAVRNQQLKATNFRWAPTAAAGFAQVQGSIANGESVQLTYDPALFNPDGTLSPHIVREPRNETCLQCHAQPVGKNEERIFGNEPTFICVPVCVVWIATRRDVRRPILAFMGMKNTRLEKETIPAASS